MSMILQNQKADTHLFKFLRRCTTIVVYNWWKWIELHVEIKAFTDNIMAFKTHFKIRENVVDQFTKVFRKLLEWNKFYRLWYT